MARFRERFPGPPDDVCDTREEVDAYYEQMQDALEEARVDPDDY